ncbi:MAG: SDR family NAD(P)-dependent oxidoreductase [Streptosporangiales bacterium]|nr:SDR family NAD(P)-dependent oxidoreductase [Streptosporangiales bacterium]
MSSRRAVVTGASTGIGYATARQLAAAGFEVVAVARRKERLDALAAEVGPQLTPLPCDITDDADLERLVEVAGDCHVLVNNAGGARGQDPVEHAKDDDWQFMYDANVLGTMRVTRALLPALERTGDGYVVIVSSIAGHEVYPGGAGYHAAKYAQAAMAKTLRLELVGRPVRVTEVAPGMVRTEEFSLSRFDGDKERAEKVYAGVAEPLVADDVADCISWCVTRPSHVNVDLLVVKPRAQADGRTVHRDL